MKRPATTNPAIVGFAFTVFFLTFGGNALFAQAPRATKTAPACSCENIAALQQELAVALALMDKHAAKARELRERYGASPKGDELAEARRNYARFENPPAAGEKPAPGSARDGLPPAPENSPAQVAFVPRGQKLFEAHARDNRNNPDSLAGIPEGVKYTPVGQPVPDTEQRKAIEDKFRKAGKDLCDHADEAATRAAMASGGACIGITRSLATHEASHQQTCRAMGYYAFMDRHPAQLADDEVRAYKAQVDALANEIRRILSKKNVKIISGTPGADPASLAKLQIRCALAINVSGKIDDLKLFGDVCDTAEAFTIKTAPNANFRLTPSSEKGGAYAYSGQAGGAHFHGSGGYTIELDGDAGTLTLDGAGRWNVTHPLGRSSKGGPEKLRVNKLRDGCA
ncbi:MAG: hypothetical protein LCH38_03100 [Proteobacteria bacterium]|nr:hypothetical protein [Pseudomonadota bacterium]